MSWMICDQPERNVDAEKRDVEARQADVYVSGREVEKCSMVEHFGSLYASMFQVALQDRKALQGHA